MKLFQKLLLASTAIGILSPIAASASEVNLKEVSNYTESDLQVSKDSFKPLSSKNPLLAGGEGLNQTSNNNFDTDSFSSTTTLDGKAVFVVGYVDGNNELSETTKGSKADSNGFLKETSKATQSEAVSFAYVYQMNLNTSFTGDDNLYVRLKTGDGFENFISKPGTYHNEANKGGSVVTVDKIWYTIPLGDKVTATIGPKIENYYMLAATPSVYKPKVLKAFRFGGHGAAFGASTSTGLGLKWEADNGFATSVTVNSKGAQGKNGFLTKEDENKVNAMAAYTADNYHVSATYTRQSNNWDAWHYFSTDNIDGDATGGFDATGWALRAWVRPDETGTAIPSVSVGFDTMTFTNTGTNKSKGFTDASGYSLALNWSDIVQADDTIGIAVGQPMKGTGAKTTAIKNTEVDPFLWEAYYSFRPNDSIEITPGIFGGKNIQSDEKDDIFGGVLTTTFRF